MKKSEENKQFPTFLDLVVWNLGWLVGFAITVIYCLK
jgi:tetrahydromethanopterin S-methyltransferase subunit E